MNYILKNKIFFLAIVITVSLFSGCGYKQITTQTRDTAFLKFNKSLSKNYIININNKYEFDIRGDISNKLYKIKSGKINLKVYNDKHVLLLQKEYYIGSNNTKEVDLP